VTVAVPDSTTRELAQLADQVELLQESLLDAQMALDESGWSKLGETEVMSRETLRKNAQLARVMALADPLIRRGVNLRIAYVWGQGVTVAAKQEDQAEQDVNAVVQAFLDDPANKATWTSGQAREELERRLATDGNAFHALVTSPLTGRVQVRLIPFDQVDERITNPDDGADVWFYRRTYTTKVVEAGYSGQTRTRRETRTVYYPAVGYYPATRPRSIDGRDVRWDSPVVHTVVNRPDGSDWGVGDLFAALPWAKGYKLFLQDWAGLVHALSRLAFKATAKGRNAPKIRASLAAAPEDGIGGTVTLGEGQSIEAIGKSGATIDSNSGRPLAAMVAAGIDVPVTMLLSDPGITGARATAETLDQPFVLTSSMRRDLHSDLIRTVCGYVILQAVKTPQGPLKGRIVRDPVTNAEQAILKGDQSLAIDVDWPSLDKVDIKTLIDAIVAADSTMKMPPLVTLRLLLIALDVENVGEVLDAVTGPDGEFLAPEDTAAARAQQNAVAGGDLPTEPALPPAPPAA
jgi:hypothetical protein